MDNASRSKRTRAAAIDAALAIIVRDGPGRLTLDAIAKESGISKGGLMHQFRTKEAVLRALVEHQTNYFNDFSCKYLAEHSSTQSQPSLAAQIAISREILMEPKPVAFAMLGAVALEPGLLSIPRETDAKTVDAIKAESDDPDLSLLRWAAARGLAVTGLLGICPFSDEERERLFTRLLDDRLWAALSSPETKGVVPSKAETTED